MDVGGPCPKGGAFPGFAGKAQEPRGSGNHPGGRIGGHFISFPLRLSLGSYPERGKALPQPRETTPSDPCLYSTPLPLPHCGKRPDPGGQQRCGKRKKPRCALQLYAPAQKPLLSQFRPLLLRLHPASFSPPPPGYVTKSDV